MRSRDESLGGGGAWPKAHWLTRIAQAFVNMHATCVGRVCVWGKRCAVSRREKACRVKPAGRDTVPRPRRADEVHVVHVLYRLTRESAEANF